MRLRYYFTVAKMAFIIIAPLVLLILPANFFDNGESMCLSQLLFKVECYACGMTRGIMHLIHFDFEKAYEYHMLSFIVLPLLGVIWIQWLLKEIKLYRIYKASLAS